MSEEDILDEIIEDLSGVNDCMKKGIRYINIDELLKKWTIRRGNLELTDYFG